jgi:hypothetical protein
MLTLTQIRSRFARLPETAYKQMGLRRVRDALALADRNAERVQELHAQAAHYLACAEAL